MSERAKLIGARWLGVGLTSALAVLTLVLVATDQFSLYVNPAQEPFAVVLAVIALVGAAASFALPLGAEADHGHEHPDDHDHAGTDTRRGRAAAAGAAVAGGAIASAVVAAAVLLPPTSLSVQLAQERDTGTAPLFSGADEVVFAASVDTSQFGVGGWAAAFARSTTPETFDGAPVDLTGFIAPGDDGARLGRLVITHCVIDAQPAYVPLEADDVPAEGQWVEITGHVSQASGGDLVVTPDEITPIAEPDDPYEY
ncbi:TIGR03943 family putative permease subunit [Microbacterium halophytorum]|uniref:TIGR03943 family putative permease subunit n=1 Tax=Microbacterium halophytorum TaxID=2067568 RepID=UPI001E4FD90F|nr:TIGR03943 family protein [Microbacterium halophytorum]